MTITNEIRDNQAVEVSATGRSLVQRSPTDCGVSLCVIKCNNPPYT